MPRNACGYRDHDADRKIKGLRKADLLYRGAPSQIRTGDLILTMDALYLLSYRGGTQTALEVYHSHFALTIKSLSSFDYRRVFYYNAQVLNCERTIDA